jgi:uncharacterized protein YgiM (DUF1202 family)
MALSILFILSGIIFAAEPDSVLLGEVKENNVNIRADSTVSSAVICTMNQGEYVEIIKELYGWYKIRLPKIAPAFIKKTLVSPINQKTAKVSANRVNLRLGPAESFAILGKADQGEVVKITQDSGQWYQIEPTRNSFGWINKGFVELVEGKERKGTIEPPAAEEKKTQQSEELFKATGTIKTFGRAFWRKTTHMLISAENKTYLLSGNRRTLNSFLDRKACVTGKLIAPPNEEYPIIEVINIESAD